MSLIVPTYNVEPYIEAFLASVTSQTTGLRNLELIIVDDGSTDRSGEIAQAWMARYPETIRYIRQDNQGTANARNTGLASATGKWVSFPDPDDILPAEWLASFDSELRRKHARPLLIVARPLHFFRESSGKTTASHPLQRMFKKRAEISTDDMGDFIFLSSAISVFRRSEIARTGLRFDPRVRPSFEDGHFVNLLISRCPNHSIAVLPSPAYIYRKRLAGNSLLDIAHDDPEWFTDQLRHGYLDLLMRSRTENGHVPRFVQRTVLYSVGWRFRHLLNNPEKTQSTTREKRAEFLSLLDEIFAFIDADTIRSMNFGGLHEEHKLGLLAMFKGESRGNDNVFVTRTRLGDNTIQFAAYSGGNAEHDVTVFVDDEPAEQIDPSRRVALFVDRPFFTEHRFWVKASKTAQLRATTAGRPAGFKSGNRQIGNSINLNKAAVDLRPPAPNTKTLPKETQRLRSHATSSESRSCFANCWVLMDREDVADDNAEHLYRYLMEIGKAEKVWFVLRADSADWERLEAEGFQLLEFGSDDHVAALVSATVLASSHAGHSVLWPVEKSWIHDLVTYRFVYLRHGVAKDNLSRWLNPKPISLVISSARAEWDSIASPSSNYIFSQRETKLTGFPRHDALLAHEHTRDTILIMPTWRRYLVGDTLGVGNERQQLDGFFDTEYALQWRSLLTNPQLRTLAEQHGKKIVFCPHPNMAIYLGGFDLPGYIECRDARKPPTLQAAFAEAAILITDYSSVAFDCAYIEKPIVYHQFDRDEFNAGKHVYTPGYFDYRDHGFGPVTETLDQAIEAIRAALEDPEDEIYAKRRGEFFAFRDGKCCERVYNEIVALEAS